MWNSCGKNFQLTLSSGLLHKNFLCVFFYNRYIYNREATTRIAKGLCRLGFALSLSSNIMTQSTIYLSFPLPLLSLYMYICHSIYHPLVSSLEQSSRSTCSPCSRAITKIIHSRPFEVYKHIYISFIVQWSMQLFFMHMHIAYMHICTKTPLAWLHDKNFIYFFILEIIFWSFVSIENIYLIICMRIIYWIEDVKNKNKTLQLLFFILVQVFLGCFM